MWEKRSGSQDQTGTYYGHNLKAGHLDATPAGHYPKGMWKRTQTRKEVSSVFSMGSSLTTVFSIVIDSDTATQLHKNGLLGLGWICGYWKILGNIKKEQTVTFLRYTLTVSPMQVLPEILRQLLSFFKVVNFKII